MVHKSKNTIESVDFPINIKKILFLELDKEMTLEGPNGPYMISTGDGKEKELKFSKLDFKDFSGLSDLEVIEAIKKDIKEDITTQAGLDKLNDLFMLGISQFYLGTRRDRIMSKRGFSYPSLNLKLPFRKYTDVIHYIRSIEENRRKKETTKADLMCYLTKIASVVNDLIDNNLDKLDEIEPQLFAQISGILNIYPVSGDVYIGRVHGKEFMFYGRPKKAISSVGKGLSDVTYGKLERIKDGIGYTFEMQNRSQDDKLFIIGRAINAIRSLGGEKIEIAVAGNKGLHLSHFGVNIKREKKGATNDDFELVKITAQIPGVSGGVEIRITEKGNRNQKGLAFSGIYKMLSSDIEGKMIRHFSKDMTDDELKDEVILFFDDLDIFLKENPETQGISREEFEMELWDDMKEKGFIDKNKSRDFDKHPKVREAQLSEFKEQLINGLTKYYKSKLEEVQDGEYTSQRALLIKKAIIEIMEMQSIQIQ
ncbi:MAG: hypothetical protein PHS92_05230 [Candidatus Gracilibacteria bacterium]|nr:hypothetical protein [Candidatus Gracilibacteria bacterium]